MRNVYILVFSAVFFISACSAPASKKVNTAENFKQTGSSAEKQDMVPPSSLEAVESIDEKAVLSALGQLGQSVSNYEIQPGDLLEITIFQEPEMNRTVRVSGTGTINIPLAGQTKIGKLTVPEAENILSEKLSQYLKSPQVSVLIKEYSNKNVYVLGEVKKPGSIDLPAERKITVLEAITLSGGFTEIAAQDRTRVLRRHKGKSEFIKVEISKITKDGDKSADIELEPNDVVFVPQSFF
ncbi:MAG: polysaccharide biosynthesis/export family protein [Elusimicrobiaceae bacterium]